MQTIKRVLNALPAGHNFAELLDFLRLGGLRLKQFFWPVSLALLVALFEACGVYLMIPLVKGVLVLDFQFVYETTPLKPFLFALLGPIHPSNAVTVAALILAILLSFIAKNLLQYASSVRAAIIMRGFANVLRKKILSNCLTFGKAYFDKVNAGHLQNVTIDLTSTVASRLTKLQELFVWFFILLAYLGMMFYISWPLTIFVCLIFPILNFSVARIIAMIRASSTEHARMHSELGRLVHDAFTCITLVKAYSQEDSLSRTITGMSDAVAEREVDIDRRLLLVQPVQELILLGLIVSLVSVMALIISRDGPSQISGFLVFFYIIRRASIAFGALNGMKASLATIGGPISEITAVLNGGDKTVIPDGTVIFPGLTSRIEVRSLNFDYGNGRSILSGMSFPIEPGKMTAIVGPSGAGKSTLVNLLCRFYDAPPGAIRLNGRDIRDFTTASIRSSIALVEQNSTFFNDTLKANVCFGLPELPSDSAMMRALAQARLSDLLAKLPEGVNTVIGDRGVQLSGGERQRLSIARAILKNSEILILDEATSSLDTNTERLIQEAINEIIAGKTTIVIAHRLTTIKQADAIVVIEGGKLAERGTLEELLKQNRVFRRYWESQSFY